MGSGHFLINATTRIANFITEFLNGLDQVGDLPSGTAYWRRWVVEECIYGVDINPLAVELAKLSLWILCMAKNEPLSFLNHHLKRGDSLVGAKVSEIGTYPAKQDRAKHSAQLSVFSGDANFGLAVKRAVTDYAAIASTDSKVIEHVAEKRALLDEIDTVLEPYKAICDLHVDAQLVDDISEWQYGELIRRRDLTRALPDGPTSGYFHWELEFPSIFLSRLGQTEKGAEESGGFDVVIGNPPYADIHPKLSSFLTRHYDSANSGDLYTLFLELMTDFTGTQSYGGMVLPLSITFSSSMETIRAKIKRSRGQWKISSFDRIPDALFGSNVRTRNSIAIVQPSVSGQRHLFTSNLLRWFARERSGIFSNLHFHRADAIPDCGLGWPKLGSDIQSGVLSGLLGKSARLSEIFVKSGYPVWFSQTAYNWLTATRKLPPIYDQSGNLVSQTKYGCVYLSSEDRAWFTLSILTSNFAFWFWLVYGDGFDLTKKLLGSIPLLPSSFSPGAYAKLVDLGKTMQQEMEKHTVYKWNAGKKVGNFNLRLCRATTEAIDNIIFTETGYGPDAMTDIYSFCDGTIKTALTE